MRVAYLEAFTKKHTKWNTHLKYQESYDPKEWKLDADVYYRDLRYGGFASAHGRKYRAILERSARLKTQAAIISGTPSTWPIMKYWIKLEDGTTESDAKIPKD